MSSCQIPDPLSFPQRGVKSCIEAPFNRNSPPLHAPKLSETTFDSLRRTFDAQLHHPTEGMWTALKAIATTLEAMAEDRCEPLIYVSSLDPGVGKTSAVVHFIKALLASPFHEDASVLVCLKRREQIREFISAAKLVRSDFAILTADKELNALGAADSNQTRVLLTTHSMVEKRTRGRTFQNVQVFHYLDQPRNVRIWDEAILPGTTLTLTRDAIASLFNPLRGRLPALAADLEALFDTLKATKDGERIDLPNLEARHNVQLLDLLRNSRTTPENKAVLFAESLSKMLGTTVVVRKDGVYGATLVAYEDTLPADIGPMLVLDASARVRKTYKLWKQGRGGITFLPSAVKSYRNLTVHLWDHGGGKKAFERDDKVLIDGIVATILRKPNEPWLVVHHINLNEVDVEAAVRSLLPSVGPNVSFLNWGAHDATNQFGHIPNVILAGTLFYRNSHYEALGRLALGLPGAQGTLSEEVLLHIAAGEQAHLILQALCRSGVRRCVEGGCPKTEAYVIGSRRWGLGAVIEATFPGAHLVPWEPVLRALDGKVGQALVFLYRRLNEAGVESVTVREVMAVIGWTDAKNFRRNIRRHKDFISALDQLGIWEISGPGPVKFVRNRFKTVRDPWDF
jgi:hypothetical protein